MIDRSHPRLINAPMKTGPNVNLVVDQRRKGGVAAVNAVRQEGLEPLLIGISRNA